MGSQDLPVITVLMADAEDTPPGLEAVRQKAEVRLAWDEPSLSEALPGADILLVTDFRTDALKAAWSSADRLKWIHATSAGVDALMIPEVIESEILVTNARGIFDRSIADYVLTTILMFIKDFPRSMRLQHQHRWQHRDTERVENRRVMVVGAGSIGRQIARLCRAVGLEVDGVARSERPDDEDFRHVWSSGQMPDQLAQADFVVIAAPLTPETEGLFDEAMLARMKPQARLINIGRGPIVRTEALVKALREGHLAGAALDVFEQEPLPEDHPLWDLENTILTAHMAGDFIGWRRALIDQFLENYERWQKDKSLFNLVDKDKGYASS